MIRRLILMLVLLCLPLQGVMATVMPFCKHAMGSATSPEKSRALHGSATMHVHHDQHASREDIARSEHQIHQPADAEGARLACDNCDACHLACAAAIPPQNSFFEFDLSHVRPMFPSVSYALLTSERLHHPPKASLI